ncbi:MAG: sugar transferase [Rhodospirillaceae bacterium]|nr:sugar transferase [Rhodospirillaceae bacterium]
MLKRLLDFFGALGGLIVLSPVFLAVAIAVKLSSPGPVFFRQVRVGRGGKPFKIFKFRTMTGSEPTSGPILTIGHNPRVTAVGEVLRDSKIDELPQLINVVLGHMSLVGPRPEVPKYVEKYTPEQREIILSVRPGLTGPASLKFRNQTQLLAQYDNPEHVYETIVMQEKIALNAAYIRDATFMSDVKLIFQTIAALFWRS